ncbi:hypothetical protein PanWU01x14_175350 [Parasponia andersonii]|uniref:Uncharacterized protein n=1 Tax=Parasponia andersonii TaxID=3476 RepID=A0A2P5C8F3_PARAD|nr:hypothetical protein PanWU01x14_175350 [Parasponia andersonii]
MQSKRGESPAVDLEHPVRKSRDPTKSSCISSLSLLRIDGSTRCSADVGVHLGAYFSRGPRVKGVHLVRFPLNSKLIESFI